MWRIFLTVLASFVSTNIDDIFVLMVLFAQASGKTEQRRIITGQFLGMSLLTGISLFCAFGARLLPDRFLGLLGILPIAIGIKTWLEYRQKDSDEEAAAAEKSGLTVLSAALIAIADGGDNVGVYIPVFSGYSLPALLFVFLLFTALTGLWCLAGIRLADNPHIKAGIQKYQQILVPAVLIALGILILAEHYLSLFQ